MSIQPRPYLLRQGDQRCAGIRHHSPIYHPRWRSWSPPPLRKLWKCNRLASGFFWRPNIIVTADETLADGGKVAVELHDGTVLEAALVGHDPATDIALLRLDSAHAQIADFSPEPLRAGALTLIVGAAESAPLTAFGMIAAVGPAWQSMRGGTIAARIELDLQLRQRIQVGLPSRVTAGPSAWLCEVRAGAR